MDSIFVLMNKDVAFKGIYFGNEQQARNFLKFYYPKRTFKEPDNGIFVCANYGTKFELVELQHFTNFNKPQ